MVDHHLGVLEPTMGGCCHAPRGADQQTRRGEFRHHFSAIFFDEYRQNSSYVYNLDLRLETCLNQFFLQGEGVDGGEVERPDHQASQPRRPDHLGGHLS